MYPLHKLYPTFAILTLGLTRYEQLNGDENFGDQVSSYLYGNSLALFAGPIVKNW
jgi:hypothetical protein